jgi:hypothetical protein
VERGSVLATKYSTETFEQGVFLQIAGQAAFEEVLEGERGPISHSHKKLQICLTLAVILPVPCYLHF